MRTIIGFHLPDGPNGYLSNWYPSVFEKDGVTFSSMEQYMMYSKAVIFGDHEIARQIMMTDNVGKIKALGRAVSHYDDLIWSGLRQIIVYDGLLAKFEQNAHLRQLLLETGDAVLAECAVQDLVWGIGLSIKDDRRFDMTQWRGANLLGFALMQVRSCIGR